MADPGLLSLFMVDGELACARPRLSSIPNKIASQIDAPGHGVLLANGVRMRSDHWRLVLGG